MEMAESDIVKEYREAMYPQEQIGILADLNSVPRKQIVDVLIRNGIDVPQMRKDIDRLLIIADRFQKIGSEPDLTPMDVIPLINDTVAYMRTRVSNKVEIDNSALDGVSRIVAVNAPLLQWVIENLLKNAVDAMAGMGTITLHIHENDHELMIDISDTGRGMDGRTQRRIFDAGFTTKDRGWGLGLPLAKRIVEQYHGGKLLLKESEPGVGSTFRIVLKKSENS